MWLAEHLAAREAKLRAGDVITLGSVVKTIYPEAGTRIEARFDRLPSVLLQIAAH
jgi:2-keto-4-pentenoate hydratase